MRPWIGLRVDHCRGHQEDRSLEGHRGQVHVTKEVPEQGVRDETLLLLIEADPELAGPIAANQDMARLHLNSQTDPKHLLEVRLQVAPLVVTGRPDDLESALSAKGE